MALKTTRWDITDHLKTKEDIAGYLDAVLEDGDPELLKLALGDIARSKGMTEIARAAGLGGRGDGVMATVKKGILVRAGEWWKHLRWTKRPFWKKHRKAEQRAIRKELKEC